MTEGSVPATVGDVLGRISEHRSKLDAYVGTLSQAQLTAAPAGGWSVQHHLSHIAAWERMFVAHLTDASDHAVASMTPDEFARASLEDINGRLHVVHQKDSLDQTLAGYASAHDAMLALINRLTDDDLRRPYWDDDPTGRTIAEKIAGDTYGHYAEHLEWITELVEGQRA